MREIQLKVPRTETDAYAAIMDQYIINIMQELKKELTTGQGDMKTTLKLWRQYHHTLASVVTPPYLGYIKVSQGLRNSLWICYGGKSLYFYEDSKELMD